MLWCPVRLLLPGADLGSFARGPPNANRRSQYQANLAMKVNAKVGGVNTCWSVLGHELLCKYFNKEVRAALICAESSRAELS